MRDVLNGMRAGVWMTALMLAAPLTLGVPVLAQTGQATAGSGTTAADKTSADKGSAEAGNESGKAADQTDQRDQRDQAVQANQPELKTKTKAEAKADSKAESKAQAEAKAAAAAQTPIVLVEPGSQKVDVRKGSVDDVDAVGNRDIGARGIGNWYSTDYEIRLGRSYAAEIEKSTKFINDPVITEYVNRIGQNLVKNSDAKVPFTIKVIDSDEINAMALPGGFFYVNSGLILNADEEAELAGVMAHEIAHVAAHHAARQMTRSNYAQIGMVPLIFIGGWTGYGLYEAASIGIPLTFLHFSREFEAQADYLGVQYMYRAGYDPQAFISFFEKIQALEKRKPGTLSRAFADHPQTPDRIGHSQDEIARILPAKDEYTVTTSEFDDIKARLARIENKRRLTDSKDKNRPSLRKASASKDGKTADDKTAQQTDPNANPDDKPTLHRREDNNNNN